MSGLQVIWQASKQGKKNANQSGLSHASTDLVGVGLLHRFDCSPARCGAAMAGSKAVMDTLNDSTEDDEICPSDLDKFASISL